MRTCACSSSAITAGGAALPDRCDARDEAYCHCSRRTLIQHLGLTRRLKAETQHLSKRPSRPANPDPGRDTA